MMTSHVRQSGGGRIALGTRQWTTFLFSNVHSHLSSVALTSLSLLNNRVPYALGDIAQQESPICITATKYSSNFLP